MNVPVPDTTLADPDPVTLTCQLHLRPTRLYRPVWKPGLLDDPVLLYMFVWVL